MKTFSSPSRPAAGLFSVVSRGLAVMAAGVLLGACGGKNESGAGSGGAGKPVETGAVRTVITPPEGHELTERGHIVATDLAHGRGAQLLAVRRVWEGEETANRHFGPGWSDANVVRLSLADAGSVLIWRGGVGWRMAYREAAGFVGAEGEKISETPGGWLLEAANGFQMNFDKEGRLLSEKDGAGTATVYAYNGRGLLVSVGESETNTLRYEYDAAERRVMKVSGPEGLKVTCEYDAAGRLTAVVSARKVRTEYTYTADGKLASAQDQFGHQLTAAQLTAVLPSGGAGTAAATAEPVAGTLYDYDAQGLVKGRTENGKHTTVTRDAAGRASAVTSDAGRMEFAYDVYGRIASLTNAAGQTTQYTYNAFDLPTVITKAGGVTERRSYDEHGRLTARETSAADREEWGYDRAGRLNIVRQAPAAETQYTYDDQDRIVMVKYPDGHEVTYGYDEAGRVVSETSSAGGKRSRRLDAQGNEVESVSAAGLQTVHVRNAAGGSVTRTDALHGKTTIQQTGQVRTVTTEAAGSSVEEMSEQGRLLAKTAPGGARTTYAWSPAGPLEAVTSASGLRWSYQYDAAGRLTDIRTPAGRRTTMRYDMAGRLAAVTRGGALWREFRYDGAGRLQQSLSAAGPASAYTYDASGRVETALLAGQAFRYTRDERGLKCTVESNGFRQDEEFYGDGTLARRVWEQAGLDLKLPRDSHGRPAGCELNGLKASHVWNDRGQIVRIDLPGGGAVNIVADEGGRPLALSYSNGVGIALSYDKADRLTGVKAAAGDGTDVFSERYVYDAAGNVSEQVTGAAPALQLQYDKENRLAAVTGGKAAVRYGYDPDGNLSSLQTGATVSPWVLDKQGRPVEQGAKTWTWNAGGCLAAAENAKGRTEYGFDAAGRLVRRSDGKRTSTFGYLPEGDRLWKQGPEGGKSWFAWLPDRLAGCKDSSGVTWLLVCLPGTTWPLAVCGSNGQTLFVVTDLLHSTRRFVDQSGRVVAGFDFEPFGGQEQAHGEAPLVLFAGMMAEGEGLYYARQRYYDAQLARFISPDPELGTPDLPASHNTYAYAANNPLLYVDETGTAPRVRPLTSVELGLPNPTYQPASTPLGEWGVYRPLTGPQIHPSDPALLDRALRSAVVYHEGVHWAQWQMEMQRRGINPATMSLAQQDAAFMRWIGRTYDPSTGLTVLQKLEQGAAWQEAHHLVRDLHLPVTDPRVVSAIEYYETAGMGKKELLEKTLAKFSPGAATEVGEGIIKRWAGRALKAGGRALELANPVMDAEFAASTGAAAGGAYIDLLTGPFDARLDADARAREMAGRLRRAYDDIVRNIARDHPELLAPLPDGRMPDPNNAQDMAEVLIGVHQNLTFGRKPMEGVLKDPDAPLPTAKREADLKTALETARRLIATARVMETSAVKAQTTAAAAEADAKTKLESATLSGGLQAWGGLNLGGLPGIAQGVTVETASMRTKLTAIDGAVKAMTAAGLVCEAAADKICGYAGQVDGASEDQIKSWQTEAVELLSTAAAQLNAAQAQLDGLQAPVEELRTSLSLLQSNQMSLETMRLAVKAAAVSGNKPADLIVAAKAAAATAQKARESIPGLLDKITKLAAQAREALAPFAGDPRAAALIAEADQLGSSITAAPLVDLDSLIAAASLVVDPLVAALSQVEQAITGLDLATIMTEGQSALTEGEAALTRARALASAPDRYRHLQRASQCYARVKPKGAELADGSGAVADEEATVPDLSAFSESGEMKAVLTHAGLKPAFAMSKDPQPEDKKGQWFAGQLPAPGTKVKKGTAVTILAWQTPAVTTTNPSDNNPPAVDEEATVPDLSAFTESGEMKAVLAHAGLKPGFAMSKDPQPEDRKGQWFAGQSPAAGTKVKKGSAVTILAWQPPAVAGPATGDDTKVPLAGDEEAIVPDLSVFTGSGEMKAVIAHAGLKAGFAMSKEARPEEKKGMWFAGQAPAAGTKVKKGTTVTILAWQNTPGDIPPPPVLGGGPGTGGATKPGTMPNLIGLTLEQAVAQAGKNMTVNGDEVGDKPPTKEKAFTIFSQDPPAGTAVPRDKPVMVRVKRYGTGKDLPGIADGGKIPPVAGGNDGLIGTFDGTIDLPQPLNGATNMKTFLTIAKNGDKWSLTGAFPPVMANPGGQVTETITASGSTLTDEAKSPNFDLTIKVTVSGDTLTGTYTLVEKHPAKPAAPGPRFANGIDPTAKKDENPLPPKTTELDIRATRRK